jgi:hypothetical protein
VGIQQISTGFAADTPFVQDALHLADAPQLPLHFSHIIVNRRGCQLPILRHFFLRRTKLISNPTAINTPNSTNKFLSQIISILSALGSVLMIPEFSQPGEENVLRCFRDLEFAHDAPRVREQDAVGRRLRLRN